MLDGYIDSFINLDVIDAGFGALITWNVSEIAIGSNNSIKQLPVGCYLDQPLGIGAL